MNKETKTKADGPIVRVSDSFIEVYLVSAMEGVYLITDKNSVKERQFFICNFTVIH